MNRSTQNEPIKVHLDEALELHRKGDLAQAAIVYERILRMDRAHPDATQLLGLIASERGEHLKAIKLVDEAVALAPLNAVVAGNLGVVLKRAGRVSDAIGAYLRAIELDPGHVDAVYNLGRSYQEVGRLVEARQAFERCVELRPEKPDLWLSLLKVCVQLGDLGAAMEWSLQAIAACPENIEVWLSAGAIARRQGQLDRAAAYYRQALEMQPRRVAVLTRLATVLFFQGNVVAGQKYLELASRLEPACEPVALAMGLMHKTIGDWSAAIERFEFALNRFPQRPKTLASLAECQRLAGKLSEAEETIDKAIGLSPNNVVFLAVQGGILLCLGKLKRAISAYRIASRCAQGGGNYAAHQNLLVALQYVPAISARSLLREHKKWDESHARQLFEGHVRAKCMELTQPLRIGFVSADLGAHPLGYFTARLFDCLDPQNWKTYIYSDRVDEDWLSKRIRSRTSCWIETRGLSDASLAKQIRGDEIDILVDLAGHTSSNRLLVFARRVAPMQISWAGYVGTTGMSQMDFVLADFHHVPKGSESSFSESVLRLPDSYITFLPHRDAPSLVELPALHSDWVTFASMCNPAKVNRDVLQLWAKVLGSIPKSRLILCYPGWPDRANRGRVTAVFAKLGCENRVEFHERKDAVSVLALYNQVDIALDTFPYSGGLTTCEAMWMGVPTITLPGRRFASRHAFSHLSNVGLAEFIATSPADYLAKAVQAVSDLPKLAELRRGLRSRVEMSPLCDGESFAKHFSSIMREAFFAKVGLAASSR